MNDGAPVQLPLTGTDGLYPGDEKCVVCGAALRSPPERIRMFVGITSSSPTTAGGVHFDLHWYGPQLPGRTDGGLRTVRVLPENDDPEAEVEFCSANCLRRFFDTIVASIS